jgi:hypothetical protein
VTHRLRRRAVVTGDDCIAIETNEVFVFRTHRLCAVGVASEAQTTVDTNRAGEPTAMSGASCIAGSRKTAG